ncbi:MAG: CAAX geranylgeranyltransferase alpha subunit [Caeruleum heppii]|nr:MAG: CAAX geranylgeranyltransferase alpha subunit [Caeruleum heppii]
MAHPTTSHQTPYATSPLWSDITPLPQDDGGPNPLAAIAYTDAYSEAMSYLRAVMALQEYSDRVLELTERIVGMNPAHYTVWLYRAKCLFELDKDLGEEMRWLNGVALRWQKNYQIWHHRQLIMDKYADPSGEPAFIAKMFEDDAKNYHVWSYRQWLVRRFSLWDTELPDIDRLLDDDVRNNSAWNHRYFVVFGREDGEPIADEIVEREIEYAKEAIRKAPQNPSPWNYLRGVLTRTARPLSTIHDFSVLFADLSSPSLSITDPTSASENPSSTILSSTTHHTPPTAPIRSSHALDILADIYAATPEKKADAERALDLLASTYDPVRANYWIWRKGLLGRG